MRIDVKLDGKWSCQFAIVLNYFKYIFEITGWFDEKDNSKTNNRCTAKQDELLTRAI